jgi:hypothetical protein
MQFASAKGEIDRESGIRDKSGISCAEAAELNMEIKIRYITTKVIYETRAPSLPR